MMIEKKIWQGCDSDVYVYTVKDKQFLLKKYFSHHISDILTYHNIQNIFAKKTLALPAESFKHLLYKSKPVTAVYFSVLYLDPKAVWCWSLLKNRKELVFSTLTYVPWKTLKYAEEHDDFVRASWSRKRKSTSPTRLLQRSIADVLHKKYPILQEMCENIAGWLLPYHGGTWTPAWLPEQMCWAMNVKIIGFRHGVLDLCITDMGGDISDFIWQYDYFSKKKSKK